MRFHIFCLTLGIVILSSCISQKLKIKAVTTEIDFMHIGKGNYKKVISYKYIHTGKEYYGEETFYYRGQIPIQTGDTIYIEFNPDSPEKSEIVSLLKSSKPLRVIEL